MCKTSIFNLAFEELQIWLENHAYKKNHAREIYKALFQQRVMKFTEIKKIPSRIRVSLEKNFVVPFLKQHSFQQAKDGTTKFLLRLDDGYLVETVLMRHKFGLSVCVTTQVGCNIGCSFCASGLQKKKRDLLAGEMINQVMKVQTYLDELNHTEKVSHVVVMGIGEPLDNYEQLVKFLKIIKNPHAFAIAGRRITVSTSGLVDKIYSFADQDLKVNLAISLHAASNELRSQIMKINKAFSIEKLLAAVDYYLMKNKRRITFEYILLKEVNDQLEHAMQLASLIGERKSKINVNLIPYNPVDEHSQYQRTERKVVSQFFDRLKKQGISCSVRVEHGAEIAAACGQLRSQYLKTNR